jgi:hypothetical protein
MSTHTEDSKHPETPAPRTCTPAEAKMLQCIYDIEPQALHDALQFVFSTTLFNSNLSLHTSEKEDLHRVQELMEAIRKLI